MLLFVVSFLKEKHKSVVCGVCVCGVCVCVCVCDSAGSCPRG